MSNPFALNLPIDIPWERICVSKDMLDAQPCDEEAPPKWNSSVAVFRYVPPDEYQRFPAYRITYLKVSATVTGYQPRDREVEGKIDWNGLGVDLIPDVEALLDDYLPCTGALLQVTVGPHGKGGGIQPQDHPFFLDFEPKSRSLYEMASDTSERASRSQETIAVGKSTGTLESLEVLDIFGGEAMNVGAQASYAGTGGGYQAGYSYQGQWGTKSLGGRTSDVMRTTDQSTEKREAQSFTTQLSQMYHLLEAYHVGTNRALFFIQPRPHVLEQPSGFVRGPRPVDGIQEFFLVVAQRREQEDFCVSVRLDTSHLTERDILEHAYRTEPMSISASAPAPTNPDDPRRQSAPNERINVIEPIGGSKIGERIYKCWDLVDQQSITWPQAPSDYVVDIANNGGYTTTHQSSHSGSTRVDVHPAGESITLTATARGHHCVDHGGTICLDCPYTRSTTAGSASRAIVINLKSREPIRKVGTEKVVVVTSRGVCCCERRDKPSKFYDGDHLVLDVKAVGKLYEHAGAAAGVVGVAAPAAGASGPAAEATGSAAPTGAAPAGPTGAAPAVPTGAAPAGAAPVGTMTAREANELSDLIRADLVRTVGGARAERTPDSLLLTDFFVEKLESRLRQRGHGRTTLARPAADVLPSRAIGAVAKHMGAARDEVTAQDVVALSNDELAQVANVSPAKAAELRLGALGIPLKQPKPASRGRSPKGKAAAD